MSLSPAETAATAPAASTAPSPAEVNARGTDPAEAPFSRLELAVGADGLERLQRARVMVLGLGGVGSACVEALTRGGVGGLVLVDGDTVQPSNINRQVIAFTDTVGMRKTDAARLMALRINPEARIETVNRFVLPEDLPELLAETGAADGGVDYVVDAIDTIATKIALAEASERYGFKLVSSMGTAMKVHPELLEVTDIEKTAGDPVARVMRRELRKRGIRHLTVVCSTEHPRPCRNETGAAPGRRAPLGTVSFVPPVAGMLMAGEVIRTLAGL